MGLSLPVLFVSLLFLVGECLGGHEDAQMAALRDAFQAADSLPINWSEGVSGNSCAWPGVTCLDGDGDVIELVLYDNQLSYLPPEVGNLTSLLVLDLGGNQLVSLPPEIRNLELLEDLVLDDNQFDSFPPEVVGLTNLICLDISNNQLESLSPVIGNLTPLRLLALTSNQLVTLPDELWDLTLLMALYIDGNQLLSLPPGIGNMTSLDSLVLNGNQLTSLPSEIENLKSLKFLALVDNPLRHLPPEIGSLTSLTELYLSYGQLTSLPAEIGNLKSLHELYLFGNQLGALPSTISGLTALTRLSLENNQLRSLPPEIGGLSSLQLLSLANNQLTSLPHEFWRLETLIELYMRGNQLTGFPPEIGGLEYLTSLFVDGNRLTGLPPEIGGLMSLQAMGLSENQLTHLPPEIGNLTSLSHLYLDQNQLESLPPEIGKLTVLTDLRLDNNRLTHLPPEIGNLTGLHYLNLGKNRLTSLPDEFWSLKSLDSLYLSDNQLTNLPSEIGSLTFMVSLDLGGNQLSALPVDFWNLTSIIDLHLSNNLLTRLPNEVGNLVGLNELYLDGNQLTALPFTIEGLTSLEYLSLRHNRLTTLPPEIGSLRSLLELDLGNNLLMRLPTEIQHLPRIQDLYLNNNRLMDRVYGVEGLSSLLWLDISGNRLRSFLMEGNEILSWLDVSNNRITEYSFVESLGGIGTLDISNNPLLPNQRAIFAERLQFLTARNCFQDDLSSLRLEYCPSLSFVDLSDSPGLTGVLPDTLGELKDLRVLRLRNTSLSSMKDPVCESSDPRPCIPSFLDPGPLVTRERSRHFSCYEPRPPPSSAQSSLLLEIDWDAYFQNQLCRCHSGFVGRLGTCHECPVNSECPGDDSQTVMTPSHGYWAPLSGNMSSALDDLQLDEVCPSYSSASVLSSPWLSVCPLTSRNMCSPGAEYTHEGKFELWASCAPGYTGRMCTGCMNGYTRWGSRCYSCPASGVTWAVYAITIVSVVLVGVPLWLWLRKDVSVDTLKILLFFAQVLALLPSLGVSIPSSLAGVSEVSSVSSLTVPGLSCVWEGYDDLTAFWFKWILFAAFVALVCCGNAIRLHFWGRSGTITAGLLFMVTSFYLPLSSLVLQSLRCERDACLGESFFVSSPHTSCDTDHAIAVRVLAWVLAFVFVLGVPLCLGWILWQARSRVGLSDPRVQAHIGQLYLCYGENQWWWETIPTMRRLLLAASVSLFPLQSGITPLALFVFLLGSAELQRAMHPYRLAQENLFELVTLLLLAGNIVGVLSLGMSEEAWSRQFIAALMVFMDTLWALVLICASLKGVLMRFQVRRKVEDATTGSSIQLATRSEC